MQPTTSPITDRTVTITRKHARRPHSVSRRPAPQPQFGPGHPTTRQQDEQSPRSRVVEAFRDLAHAVDASIAEEQTKAFYRSSGQEWAHSLTQHGGVELKVRVIDAFRSMAHGMQDTAAHIKTLHFYRSGGQS